MNPRHNRVKFGSFVSVCYANNSAVDCLQADSEANLRPLLEPPIDSGVAVAALHDYHRHFSHI